MIGSGIYGFATYLELRLVPFIAGIVLLSTPSQLSRASLMDVAHPSPAVARQPSSTIEHRRTTLVTLPTATAAIVSAQSIPDRRPIAIMIDNLSPDARPQSGLSQASMVFETLVEGGITRRS